MPVPTGYKHRFRWDDHAMTSMTSTGRPDDIVVAEPAGSSDGTALHLDDVAGDQLVGVDLWNGLSEARERNGWPLKPIKTWRPLIFKF